MIHIVMLETFVTHIVSLHVENKSVLANAIFLTVQYLVNFLCVL